MSTVDLPDLHQGVLDLPTLRQLFDDLDLCAEVTEVRTKGGAAALADAVVPFEEGRRAFESRACRGLQVRYFWEGQGWIDTLFWTPEGARVVRMKAPVFSV